MLMGTITRALDYAYGIRACLELAGGVFNRGCTPYGQHDQERNRPKCPAQGNPTLEGICDAELSAQNADSWAMVAAGQYFSARCSRHVPISAVAMEGETSSCPDYSDALAIDQDLTQPINGYAHFGDSYAAGMGTATTSGDSCRRGSNNYGELLFQWLGEGSFSDYACSGDTTVGLGRQIDRFALQNTGGHMISTLTMGGNDVLFSEIVRNCVITMGLDWPTSGEQYRKDCLATEDKARGMIQDTGPDGLGAKLMAGYKRILDTAESSKTSRPFRSMQLFVPGYVGFFNHDTVDCDFTSFYYWNPTWDAQQPCCKVYLTRELRRELNDLVNMLNDLIVDTVARANAERGTEQVHYIDMQPYFDGHRWCETNGDDYHDPDENIRSTYFFLSGWQDFPIKPSHRATAETSQVAEVIAFLESGGIQLPPAETCQEDLGTDPDPYAVFMCERAMNIAAAPNGTAAESFGRASAAIADEDYESNDISWWLPTRQIKTFHPRSPGMALYRDAVIDAMDEVGLNDEWTGD